MSEPREVFIEKLMAHIVHLTMIPKVQVERAVAPILGLFIAELLSTKWSKRVVMICEEFPLRKAPVNGIQTYQSTNIDWLLYDASDDQLVFLELKTADTSFDPLQEDIYRRLIRDIGEHDASSLVNNIKEIMCASLERKKYEEVLKCVQNPCYANCRKAKLVYLAPAVMRARRQPPQSDVEWLTFQDLPEEVSGELAVEWRIIRRHLVQLDSITRHSRNSTQEGGGRSRNYGDICGFEELVRLCEENGNTIVVGFEGGTRKLRAATLDDLNKQPAFKWDQAEGGRGFKDLRNWIHGRKFLEIVEGLMDD